MRLVFWFYVCSWFLLTFGSETHEAPTESYLFVVLIYREPIKKLKGQDEGSPYSCRGTLIRNTWVLTAAHCVRNTFRSYKYYVKFAIPDEIILVVDFQFISGDHEKCNADDIALGQLEIPTSTAPVSIDDGEDSFTSSNMVEGFTIIWNWNDRQFRKIPFIIFNDTICDIADAEQPYIYHNICGGTDNGTLLEKGYSGSPLLIEKPDVGFVLVGLLYCSYQSANRTHPAAFVRISNYYEWIENRIAIAFEEERYSTSFESTSSNTVTNKLNPIENENSNLRSYHYVFIIITSLFVLLLILIPCVSYIYLRYLSFRCKPTHHIDIEETNEVETMLTNS